LCWLRVGNFTGYRRPSSPIKFKIGADRFAMPDDKSFSKEETERRFEAALRGARLAGPKHKESVTPKRTKPQRKKRHKK
jgi:hypothetical protein